MATRHEDQHGCAMVSRSDAVTHVTHFPSYYLRVWSPGMRMELGRKMRHCESLRHF